MVGLFEVLGYSSGHTQFRGMGPCIYKHFASIGKKFQGNNGNGYESLWHPCWPLATADDYRMSVQRRASQASVGLLVVGVHLVGVLLWWTAEHGMQLVRHGARLASVAVWLPALPPLDTRQAKQPSRQHQQPAQGASVSRKQRDSTPAAPNHTLDATAAPASNGVSLPTEAFKSPETTTETPTAPALNLNLSRKAITSVAPPSFAERSPFHGRLPATVERQIATAAAETGPWAEERIDNDHIRFRRGNTCVMMQRPRAASIDPFSEAAARIPWRGNVETCQ